MELIERTHGSGVVPSSPAGALAELRHEHVIILRALAVADALVSRTAAGGRLDRPALGRLITFLREFADRCHHAKEEKHLFPALAKYGVPVEGGPIGVMLAEHDEGRRLIAATASPVDTDAAAAVTGYTRLLRAHIDKENSVLFVLAEQVLPEAEQKRLAAAFEGAEHEEVGRGEHERLVAELEALEAAVGA